jgi:phosphoribosyl 1,2-cyclic phosphate phosphodiesterase
VKVTFLGTGTSHGVPSIDCMRDGHSRCRKGVCAAAEHDPKHRRTRCSILVEHDGKRILIDISMDFREQALRERIPSLNAVLLTHRHMDHVGGLPDIRSYTTEHELPLHASAETLEEVTRSFQFAFDPKAFVGGGIPRLVPHAIEQPFDLYGVNIIPVPVVHGPLNGCFGYRIGDLAYIPDMKAIADDSLAKLKGVTCLILNCLRDERLHQTHMILSESMALARRVAPRRCHFVHMCHDIHYEQDAAQLEPWMSFAYDGQVIEA